MSLELRNILEEAGIYLAHRNSEASVPIVAALKAGLHVVVQESTYYCRSTDACVGVQRHFVASLPTYEEAVSFIHNIPEAQWDMGEANFVVRSPEGFVKPSEAKVEVLEEDDVPF